MNDHAMENHWQSAQAESALPDIIDAALDGRPQVIRRPDGKEVVVVAHEPAQAKPSNLRDYLLNSGFGEDGDAFDQAMQEVRSQGLAAFAPRAKG